MDETAPYRLEQCMPRCLQTAEQHPQSQRCRAGRIRPRTYVICEARDFTMAMLAMPPLSLSNSWKLIMGSSPPSSPLLPDAPSSLIQRFRLFASP